MDQGTVTKDQPDQSFLVEGFKAGWPICLGFIPIGTAFGVIAQKSGLNPVQIGLMSLIVFAGSSQFIAVSMLASGASAISIIITTFMVNLRHLLMSSSLAVTMERVGRLKQAVFAYAVTDETFAVNMARYRDGYWDSDRAMTVNFSANITWFISTVGGGIGGRFIPPGAFGIDYALIAMFICLLVYQIRGGVYVFAAVVAGLSAVVFALMIPGNSYIIIGSIVGATLGVVYRRRRKEVEKA